MSDQDNKIWSYYAEDFNKIGRLKDNVVHIKNFLEPEDLLAISNYLKTHQDDPEFSGGKMINFEKASQENPEVAQLLIKYEKRIYDVVEKNFCQKYNIKIKRKPWVELHFIKWRPGMGSKLHSDCQYPNGDPLMKSNYYKLNLTALIYPNEDYTGGEIGWPEYGIEIKPSAGDLAVFPANNDYLHYVNDVMTGTRYTMPIWYTFDNGAPEKEMIYDPEASKNLWLNEGEDTNQLRSY
jgi:hypothetical protein